METAAQESVNPPSEERNTMDMTADDMSGGSGMTSFDELEALNRGTKAVKTKEAKEEKEIKESLESPKKPEAREEAPKEEVEEAPEVKMLKFRAGDEMIDVRADAMIPVKIDGKTEYVPIEDLRSEYSGKTAWDKKFTEIDQIRKQVSQDILTVRQAEEQIGEIHKLAQEEGKSHEALFRIFELMGANPIEGINQLRTQFLEEMGLEDIVPEDYQSKLVQMERDYYKSKMERDAHARNEERTLADTEARMDQVIEQLGMTQDEFAETYYRMKESNPNANLEPEEVAIEYAEQETNRYLTGIVSDVNENLSSSEQIEAIKHLRYFIENTPDVTHEDVVELAASVYGNSYAKNVSKKIHQSKPADTRNSTREQKNNPLFFDDLE